MLIGGGLAVAGTGTGLGVYYGALKKSETKDKEIPVPSLPGSPYTAPDGPEEPAASPGLPVSFGSREAA